MARDYKPRRMPKEFTDGDCPDGVLDIFDEGEEREFAERYTVVYTEVLAPNTHRASIGYRGMCETPTHPQGIGMYGELTVSEMQQYRERMRSKRVKWSSLPEDVRGVVLHDCRTDAAA